MTFHTVAWNSLAKLQLLLTNICGALDDLCERKVCWRVSSNVSSSGVRKILHKNGFCVYTWRRFVVFTNTSLPASSQINLCRLSCHGFARSFGPYVPRFDPMIDLGLRPGGFPYNSGAWHSGKLSLRSPDFRLALLTSEYMNSYLYGGGWFCMLTLTFCY